MNKLLTIVLAATSGISTAAPLNYVFNAENPWIEVAIGETEAVTALTSSAVSANAYGSFTYDSDLIGVDWAISNFQVNAWGVHAQSSATAISFYQNMGSYQSAYQDGVSIGGGLFSEQPTIDNYTLFFTELQFWQASPWLNSSKPSDLDFLQGANGFLEMCLENNSNTSTTCLRIHNISVTPATVPIPTAGWFLFSAILTLPTLRRR